MSKVKYDLVVVVGEYTNQQGEIKKRYKNIGVVMENDKGLYILQDRTFNGAGMTNPDNRPSFVVSMKEPKDWKQPSESPKENTENDFNSDAPF